MGTDYKTRIKIDGEVKLCKYSSYDGYAAEKEIRNFFTLCNLKKMKSEVRKLQVADCDWFEETSNRMGLQYNKNTQEFDSESDRNTFFKAFPELTFRYSIQEFLQDVYNGNIVRTPLDEFIDEKYICYIITVDLDNDTITVKSDTTYTLPLTLMYTDTHTVILKSKSGNSVLYKCAACKSTEVLRNFKYCPMCGRKKLRVIPIPDGWTDKYREKRYRY